MRVDYLVARSGGKLFGLATRETGRDAGRPLIFAVEDNRLLWYINPPYPERAGAHGTRLDCVSARLESHRRP